MKKRKGEPWMAAVDYGRSLSGFTVNLLVRDIRAAIPFHFQVLDAQVVNSDADFAVLRHQQAEWMLHADHTYEGHPLAASLGPDVYRGLGAELRLQGRDPDEAEAIARKLGFTVLVPAQDKPHGLREACVVDGDGYLWVPGVALED